ncbi:MAG: TIGR00153 family protein [Candidatus Brocadiia bacterium]|nr:TIGR00153 family protein [Candidatus Brocadiia bacterium]
MSLIKELFGRSPFGPLVEHAKYVHECAKLIRPLMEAMAGEDYEEVHRLQDEVSKLEYQADRVKHELRESLPRRFFLPVEREDLEAFLHSMDKVADKVEDFAVILLIRKTKVHPELTDEFYGFVDQVAQVSQTLLEASEELVNLAEASFGGAEAETVLSRISGLGEQEWKADRMQRKLCQHIYSLEDQLDPITIMFYDKMLRALGSVANAAENAGEKLRMMIVKG